MAIDVDRRRLLAAAAGVALGGAACWRYAADTAPAQLLLSACDDPRGRHLLAAWDPGGGLVFRIGVPLRAHDMVGVPGQRRAVCFARRPGTLAWVVDLERGRIEQTIPSVAGRHYYGHGLFSPDGNYLYTTENDYDNARGAIGVYDAREGFRRVAEFDSHGVGPHDLALLGDGHTLVVANGGIRTHPDDARRKLNLDTMQPSLAYVDRRDGSLVDAYRPQDHRMSIRHLSVTADDRVVAGVQYEGDPARIVPLLLTHRGESALQPARAGAQEWRSHANYVASVATSADGATALVTAPRGDTVSLWDLASGELRQRLAARDASGAAYLAAHRSFVVSSGLGRVYFVGDGPSAALERRHVPEGLRWDNHLQLV